MAFAYKDGFRQKMEPRSDLSVYNTRHAWTLFSSVCLFVAATVNNPQTGAVRRNIGADLGVLGNLVLWREGGGRGGVMHVVVQYYCDPCISCPSVCATGAHSRKTGALLAQCIQLLGYMLRAALVSRLEDGECHVLPLCVLPRPPTFGACASCVPQQRRA